MRRRTAETHRTGRIEVLSNNNERGQVLVQTDADFADPRWPDHLDVVWHDGTVTPVGPPDTPAALFDISDRGHVAGVHCDVGLAGPCTSWTTDIVLEEQLDGTQRMPLGFARSEFVVASREDDGRTGIDDLVGGTIATHLPRATEQWFEPQGSTCGSWRRCEAELVAVDDRLPDLTVRLQAAVQARRHRYLMVHLAPDKIDALAEIFPGLAAPTVLPLSGREDLVAAHLGVETSALFKRLGETRALGAGGIVALHQTPSCHRSPAHLRRRGSR